MGIAILLNQSLGRVELIIASLQITGAQHEQHTPILVLPTDKTLANAGEEVLATQCENLHVVCCVFTAKG